MEIPPNQFELRNLVDEIKWKTVEAKEKMKDLGRSISQIAKDVFSAMSSTSFLLGFAGGSGAFYLLGCVSLSCVVPPVAAIVMSIAAGVVIGTCTYGFTSSQCMKKEYTAKTEEIIAKTQEETSSKLAELQTQYEKTSQTSSKETIDFKPYIQKRDEFLTQTRKDIEELKKQFQKLVDQGSKLDIKVGDATGPINILNEYFKITQGTHDLKTKIKNFSMWCFYFKECSSLKQKGRINTPYETLMKLSKDDLLEIMGTTLPNDKE